MSNLRTPEVDDLLCVFAALDDEDTIFALLEDLFTIREIKETSQRLAVARRLDAGMSYAAIENATGASATTIARVSKCLSYGAGGYRAALDILKAADKEEITAARDSALYKQANTAARDSALYKKENTAARDSAL